MKKVFFGMIACMLLSTATYANGGKKAHVKKVCKASQCSKMNCDKTTCDKSKCIDMVGCSGK